MAGNVICWSATGNYSNGSDGIIWNLERGTYLVTAINYQGSVGGDHLQLMKGAATVQLVHCNYHWSSSDLLHIMSVVEGDELSIVCYADTITTSLLRGEDFWRSTLVARPQEVQHKSGRYVTRNLFADGLEHGIALCREPRVPSDVRGSHKAWGQDRPQEHARSNSISERRQARPCGVARFFKEKGADIRATDTGKRTALHAAVISGDIGMVKKLVDLGCDVDAQDRNEVTPPMLAAKEKNRTLLDLLVPKPP
jgi:hypothetical protein